MFPNMAFAVALLVCVGFLVCCFYKPRVGRVVARIFAVIFLGGGAGGLTWGICAAALGEEIRSPFGLQSFITNPSEAIGWGAGLLTAGVTSLVLSFIGPKKPQSAEN